MVGFLEKPSATKGAGITSVCVSTRTTTRIDVHLDALLQDALKAGAVGARLIGGGFGGSIVALIESGNADAWCITIKDMFPQAKVLAFS